MNCQCKVAIPAKHIAFTLTGQPSAKNPFCQPNLTVICCLAIDCCCATTDHIIAMGVAVLPDCTQSPKLTPQCRMRTLPLGYPVPAVPATPRGGSSVAAYSYLSGDVVAEYPGQQHYGKASSSHRSCGAGMHSLFPADTLRTLWPHAARALSRPEPQACGASPLPGTAQGRLCLGTELISILAALACHLTRAPGISRNSACAPTR